MTLNLRVLSLASDWGVRISHGNPFVVIISWSFSVQWYISHYWFPHWKKMGGKHWKLVSNASSLLCSFQMECFFRLVWVCFLVCLFVLQGFFGVCGATYHSTEDKKKITISCFLYCNLSAPGEKGLCFLVFPKALNSPADPLLAVPDSWIGYLSLWMKSKKLFSGQFITSQPCKSRMTQVFFATYPLFRDFQMLMTLNIQRHVSLYASETNLTCTALKWRCREFAGRKQCPFRMLCEHQCRRKRLCIEWRW